MKFKILVLGMLAIGVVSTCLVYLFPKDTLRVQNHIRELAKDPDSVKFYNVRQPLEPVVCGELNAKNGFGAYGGRKRFLATVTDEEIVPLVEDESIIDEFNIYWGSFCAESE